jgi:hypothetical protein
MAADAQDAAWLSALVARSPLLADEPLREHWEKVIAWLPPAARHELAEILLAAEEACRD